MSKRNNYRDAGGVEKKHNHVIYSLHCTRMCRTYHMACPQSTPHSLFSAIKSLHCLTLVHTFLSKQPSTPATMQARRRTRCIMQFCLWIYLYPVLRPPSRTASLQRQKGALEREVVGRGGVTGERSAEYWINIL